MADTKFTSLVAQTTPLSGDIFPFITDPAGTPVGKKVTFANIEASLTVANQIGGGASGTGDIVRVSDATLINPALGTPASGVMTNVTGIPVSALANGTDGELITWDSSGVATTVSVGTSGHVLTSNGAGAAPTFQASAGGSSTPRLVKTFPFDITPSTDAQSSNYYTVTGSGAVTTSSGGYQLATGTTDGSQIRMRFRQNWTGDGLTGWGQNPEFIFMQQISAATAGSAILQYTIGDNGGESTSAGVLVSKHIGFLFCFLGGTLTVYASNADGSTQTTTDVTASYTGGQAGVYRCTVTSGTNVKFYIDGVLVATHTTNLPTGAMSNTATLWNDLDAGTTSGLTSIVTHWQFSADC